MRDDRTKAALHWAKIIGTDKIRDPATHKKFIDWLRDSPDHLCALEKAISFRAKLHYWIAHGRRIASSAEDGAADSDSAVAPPAMSDRIWRPTASNIGRFDAPNSRAIAVVSLVATTALAGSLWFVYSDQAWHSYVAPADGTTFLRLSDGSSFVLDAESLADVRMSKRAREIRLRSGSATFTVAHDRTRPFKVYVLGGTVQAVGTRFVVSIHGQKSVVIVQEGMVQVTGSRVSEGSISVATGQRAQISTGGSADFDPKQVQTGAPSTDARYIFKDRPLALTAKAVNEYGGGLRLRVEGAACEEKYTGRIDLNDPDVLIGMLEQKYLQLAVKRIGNTVLIGKRDDAATLGAGASCEPADSAALQ